MDNMMIPQQSAMPVPMSGKIEAVKAIGEFAKAHPIATTIIGVTVVVAGAYVIHDVLGHGYSMTMNKGTGFTLTPPSH